MEQPLNLSDDTLWHLLSTRSPTANGQFLYAVKTTRIFCRPTCKARLARRSNILYFRTSSAARAAGFRACKRCKPDLETSVFEPEAERIRVVCAEVRGVVGRGEKVPGLAEMARIAGLTKFHFHRLFKKVVGMTPREFAKGLVEGGRNGGKAGLGEDAAASSAVSAAAPSETNSTSLSSSVTASSRGGATSLTPATNSNDISIDPTPFIMPEDSWIDEIDWDSLFTLDDFDRLMSSDLTRQIPINTIKPPTSTLYYTTRNITSGKLLVAVQDGQVCWMDMDMDDMTLLQRFELTFPLACYSHLLIECAENSAERATMEPLVDEVVMQSEPSSFKAAGSEIKMLADAESMGRPWMGVG